MADLLISLWQRNDKFLRIFKKKKRRVFWKVIFDANSKDIHHWTCYFFCTNGKCFIPAKRGFMVNFVNFCNCFFFPFFHVLFYPYLGRRMGYIIIDLVRIFHIFLRSYILVVFFKKNTILLGMDIAFRWFCHTHPPRIQPLKSAKFYLRTIMLYIIKLIFFGFIIIKNKLWNIN